MRMPQNLQDYDRVVAENVPLPELWSMRSNILQPNTRKCNQILKISLHTLRQRVYHLEDFGYSPAGDCDEGSKDQCADEDDDVDSDVKMC